MNVAVVGTGYVGLVTGTCLAELGNDVTCVDNNPDKVEQLQRGEIPIYEPGLQSLFDRNVKEGRLHFTSDLTEAIGSAAIFLALPTDKGENGHADLSKVEQVARELGSSMTKYTVLITKSTVPVGTSDYLRELLTKNGANDFDIVSNPEFLREGSAVSDFMNPDRVVVGATSDRARKVLGRLYQPLVRREPHRLMFTDPASAEMIKYASNAFLATKISFVNQLTAFCEEVGADIEQVREGMGSDDRIGSAFLYPGPGYGGSCFPKDTHALYESAKTKGIDLGIVEATIKANEQQKQRFVELIVDNFDGEVKGKRIALWGLAFKDNTDDVRESPALVIVEELTKRGAEIVAFDPAAIETTKREFERKGTKPNISYGANEYDVLNDADALVIATNWKEFFTPDFNKLKDRLKAPIIIDGRNLFDLQTMRDEGFQYVSIGRPVVNVE